MSNSFSRKATVFALVGDAMGAEAPMKDCEEIAITSIMVNRPATELHHRDESKFHSDADYNCKFRHCRAQ